VAGAVNTVAGGGSLLTFPLLLALGHPPLAANVTNSVGVSSGNVGGVVGYRRELAGRRDAMRRFGAAGALGGLLGSVLLLRTPEAAFRAIVPALIASAALLVLVQPLVTGWLNRRTGRARHHPRAATLSIGAVAIYGGYFGAAMSIMVIAALGLLLPDTLQRTNALKTAITLVVNGVSALIFAFFGPVAWGPALALVVSTGVGGYLGAGLARRLPDPVLRGVVVAIGLAAAVTVALRG
jgi:uncharacterized membrane protein YfcA